VASDVTLLIVDPELGAVVVSAWVGMGGTRDRLREVVLRAPEFSCRGWECWGSICAPEALSIAEQHYANGATPDDVQRWLAQYPMAKYWWIFDHDY
jgi:hypothetical protein